MASRASGEAAAMCRRSRALLSSHGAVPPRTLPRPFGALTPQGHHEPSRTLPQRAATAKMFSAWFGVSPMGQNQ